jgi:hypothetical protein
MILTKRAANRIAAILDRAALPMASVLMILMAMAFLPMMVIRHVIRVRVGPRRIAMIIVRRLQIRNKRILTGMDQVMCAMPSSVQIAMGMDLVQGARGDRIVMMPKIRFILGRLKCAVMVLILIALAVI